MKTADAIDLTRWLLAQHTVNPPGNEAACAREVGALLSGWGFDVRFQEFSDGRANLIARAGGRPDKAPIVFTGHLDTVPLGAATWTRDPFAGEIDGDRLYGRGSSDMKSGIAAMLVAARTLAPRLAGTAGMTLVLTAAEEGGCVGSRHLVADPVLLGRAGALVVGEPTSNEPRVGHKGTVKFWARFDGVAAHGSMPHLGVNAIYKAACAACRLSGFRFLPQDWAEPAPGDAAALAARAAASHPVMGAPTLNVGTLHGGDTINSVPDRATMGVDIRTVAGMDHAALLDRVRAEVGPEASLDVFQDTPAVWTDPAGEWARRAFDLVAGLRGQPAAEPLTMTYNTDAGNLRRAWPQVPAIVLGPGEPSMAHQTDEYCLVSRIREAVAVYEALAADWCGL